MKELLKINDEIEILPPHLVPLPMGEETLPRLSLLVTNCNKVLESNLASPKGRGARQHGEGVSSCCGTDKTRKP